MWASSLALNGLCGSGKNGAWTCHPIEHELSAFYDITHGVGLAIVTPKWMKYILSDATVDKFVDYVLGKEDGIPKTPKWASEKCGVKPWTIKALADYWAEKIVSIPCVSWTD